MTPDELVIKLNKMAEQADKNAKDYGSEDRDYWQAAARAFEVAAGEAAKLTSTPLVAEQAGMVEAREAIAQIIDPHSFLPCSDNGDDEMNRFIAQMVSQSKEAAYRKADRILSALSATPKPVEREYFIGWNDGFEAAAGPLKFPTMLRKMWSGAEVQAWIDEQRAAALSSAPKAAEQAGSESANGIGLRIASKYVVGHPGLRLAKEIADAIAAERAALSTTPKPVNCSHQKGIVNDA